MAEFGRGRRVPAAGLPRRSSFGHEDARRAVGGAEDLRRNSHVRSICDSYAADGYAAIAPALFDRYQRGIALDYAAEDIARGRELKARAKTDAALSDVAAARAAVTPMGHVGVIGYCWGGFIAWMAAARLNGFSCAVSYYGGGIPEATDER